MQPLENNDPTAIGPYRLLGRIGAGGMGRVYLGRNPGGRTVAVKVVRAELADDPDFRTRFRQEAAAARRVGGAWSAPVLDADTESAVPWIATGYVAGPALNEAVTEFGPLPENGLRALGAGLAETLTAVHGTGLIHRDVKPSNVLLSVNGPRLIDFGIARAMELSATSVTGSGVVVGSPGYMAPEQVMGRPIGPASDVFALGAVLAYAATGHGPFSGDSAAVLLYKVAHEEPRLEGVPSALRDLIEACLAKNPTVRPTTEEIARRLAPEGGAAALVRDGWLPGPLMEQLAVRAVELLNLEAVPVPSPETVPLRGSGRTPSWPGGPGPSAGGSGAGPGQPRTARETPPARNRGRSAVLLAAAALALVAATAVIVLMTTEEGDPGGAEGGNGQTAPTTLPEVFAGTWKGATVTVDFGVPGTMEITIRPGAVGEIVGRDKSVVPLLDVDCGGDWKLLSATPREIVLDTSGGENPHPGICSNGSKEERFTLNDDGTLHYKSGDGAAGNPEGDLSRQEG